MVWQTEDSDGEDLAESQSKQRALCGSSALNYFTTPRFEVSMK